MSRLADMLRTLVGGGPRPGGPRVAGPPRSANGASSFHLLWELPSRAAARGLLEVSAVLEVLEPPRVDALYFWALQVDFADGRGVWGGGHTGLQWNRRYVGGTAVNWGGYASQSCGGGVLYGSLSSLPGYADDANTLAFAWQPRRPYRLRVFPSPDMAGAWRAEVSDLDSGVSTFIRDLLPPLGRGLDLPHLTRPVVWSEVFADCDAPSVVVRWSGLRAVDLDGAPVAVESARVNYQSADEGGCANTTVSADEFGVRQITNSERTVYQESLIGVGRRGG